MDSYFHHKSQTITMEALALPMLASDDNLKVMLFLPVTSKEAAPKIQQQSVHCSN